MTPEIIAARELLKQHDPLYAWLNKIPKPIQDGLKKGTHSIVHVTLINAAKQVLEHRKSEYERIEAERLQSQKINTVFEHHRMKFGLGL